MSEPPASKIVVARVPSAAMLVEMGQKKSPRGIDHDAIRVFRMGCVDDPNGPRDLTPDELIAEYRREVAMRVRLACLRGRGTLPAGPRALLLLSPEFGELPGSSEAPRRAA